MTEWLGIIPDWIQVLIAVVAAVFALRQWRESCAVSRAEHLREMLDDFNDEIVSSGFRTLIDRQDETNIVFYNGGNKFADGYESVVDRMLWVFSRICYEHDKRIISDEEFAFFEYQIRRTLQNKQIQQYLKDLVRIADVENVCFPFSPLLNQGRKWCGEYKGLKI